MRRASPVLQAILIAAAVLAVVRLLYCASEFGSESLQLDFASYYQAGRAANAGLDPYVNPVREHPELWDGVASYARSRFLYPPPALLPFRLLALLPYPAAKFLWSLLTLLMAAAAVGLIMRLQRLRGAVWIAGSAVLAAFFHPLLLHLERGQIDILTLLLLTGMIVLLVAEGRTSAREFTAGVLLAAATVFKLYALGFLPFILYRKRLPALAGFAVGLPMLFLASIATDGAVLNFRYWDTYFPQIAQWAELGPEQEHFDDGFLAQQREGWKDDHIAIQGRQYRYEYFSFNAVATLTYAVQTVLEKTTTNRDILRVIPPLLYAILALLLFFAVRHRFPGRVDPSRESRLLYWLTPLPLILLTAPLTWAMNVVWLLPFIPFLAARLQRGERLGMDGALILAGLFAAGIPDARSLGLAPPAAVDALFSLKYITAELLVFGGCILGLRRAHVQA